MELYTSNEVLNAKTVKYKGLVVVNKVTARNALSTGLSSLKAAFGGEMRGQTQLMANTRQQIISELIAKAEALGANAIVGLRYTADDVLEVMNNMMVYGTAVHFTR